MKAPASHAPIDHTYAEARRLADRLAALAVELGPIGPDATGYDMASRIGDDALDPLIDRVFAAWQGEPRTLDSDEGAVQNSQFEGGFLFGLAVGRLDRRGRQQKPQGAPS